MDNLYKEYKYKIFSKLNNDLIFGKFIEVDFFFVEINERKKRGSIGVDESKYLIKIINKSKELKKNLVIIMSSSGLNVSDGARGLKLFAELLKTISDARNKIVLVSLLKSFCLGGASIIAALSRCVYFSKGLIFGLNGPKLFIDKKNLIDDFYSIDKKIANLHQIEHRHTEFKKIKILKPENDSKDTLIEENLILRKKMYFTKNLSKKINFENNLILFKSKNGITSKVLLDMSLLILDNPKKNGKISFDLDCSSQALTLKQEKKNLSVCFAHLIKAVQFLKIKFRNRIIYNINKNSGGALYVSFAAFADKVVGTKNLNIRVLPKEIEKKMIKEANESINYFEAKNIGLVNDK